MPATLRELPMSLCYDIPNPNLRSYLERGESGNPAIYETKFGGKEKFADIVDEWHQHLQTLEHSWPTLLDYEMEQERKIGPLSYQKPLEERMGDIHAYWDGVSQGGVEILPEAIDDLLNDWPKVRNLRLRSPGATNDLMKKSTNSGAPYFTVKNRVVERTLPYDLYWRNGVIYQELEGRAYQLCATLGWRGQSGGPDVDDVKQRVLFMFPYAANIDELRCYQVLIEAMQRYDYVPAWNGNDAVDRAITNLFNTKGPEDLIICTDFTKFDQHFGTPCQSCAKTLLSRLFADNEEMRNWLEVTYPIKYNIPLNYKWQWFATGHHGMGSGSGGTNADETLLHKALQYEAARLAGQKLNPYSLALGDDGLLSFPGITVEHVVNCYQKHGLDMNPEKQSHSTVDCIYLRRWHHADYTVRGINVGVYPTMRALGKLKYMERRFPKSELKIRKLVAMRQLSILNNCQYHPLGSEFVRFCSTKDRFRLGKDIPGFFEGLDKEFEKASAIGAVSRSYLDSVGKQTPPSKWWVTDVVREL